MRPQGNEEQIAAAFEAAVNYMLTAIRPGEEGSLLEWQKLAQTYATLQGISLAEADTRIIGEARLRELRGEA